MKYYAVIDTNVLISALLTSNPNSATVLILKYVLNGKIIPLYSTTILNEYKNVLTRKKFNFTIYQINYILSAIEKYGLQLEPTHRNISLPDMDDLPFYEIVLDSNVNNTYLVTSNTKHFPKEPFIVTARQMLEIIKKS